jgi:hypothetical protein
MNIKTFKQYASGGFSYVDENNNLLGTGTTTDSAAPDPDNLTGIFIYCQNPSRSLYASVSATNPVTVILKDGTTTSVTNRKKLMEDLAEFFFYRVTTFTGLPVEIQLAASGETTALTAGTAKVTFRMPYAMTLTAVRASLTTAQTSGSIFTVDINQGGSSVLGTKLTIDNTEKTSVTAATAATITTSALTDDAEITIDIDQIGDGTATGLKITLIGTR